MQKLAMGINNSQQHAEVNAIQNLSRGRYTKCRYWSQTKKFIVDLLVIRVNKGGSIGMSKPCIGCIRSMMYSYKIRIRHVYYSMEGSEIIKVKFNDLLDEYNNGDGHVSRCERSFV